MDIRDNKSALEHFLKVLEEQSGEEDFTQRTTYTYMLGVYLAVNALADAFLLVEGPDCAYMKTQYIQGNHDWLSTLTSVSGYHRIANTALHPAMMTDSREEPVTEVMTRMASDPAVGALLLTSMPMAFVTGADYERLCSDVTAGTGKPVVHIPGLSLSGDWLDGYSETLNALARQLPLSGGKPAPAKVAVVGYLYDRNEEDHRANIRELGSMCKACGLDLVSVWLSGQRSEDLLAVRDAGTLLSLPYGGKTARSIAKQTGAEVVPMPLPFGLKSSEQWMRILGERFGAESEAEQYIDTRMRSIAPRLEWIIPYLFQNVSVGYVGDPHLVSGLKDIVELLGAQLVCAILTNRDAHLGSDRDFLQGVEVIARPTLKTFMRFAIRNIVDHNIRLLVTNNYGVSFPLPQTAVVEFGFPSVFTHALFERPFLGFGGFMAFVDTMANALRQLDRTQARPVFEFWGDDPSDGS